MPLRVQPTQKKQVKKSGFSPNWKLALAAVFLSTASGGFVFSAMTFVVPRYFEISMVSISSSVAITGLLASLVYACASFTQIAVGWIIDRVEPKWVLFGIGIGYTRFSAILPNWSIPVYRISILEQMQYRFA